MRILIIIACLMPALRAWADAPRPEMLIDKQALIEALRQQTGFSEGKLRLMLAKARFMPSVIERISSPYEARPYAEYRPLFVTESMKKMGRAYLAAHRAIFEKVERKYQVDAEVIAAILGIETRFGRSQGKDRVLDALYTLAVGYPRRAAFFTRELGEWLLLCEEERLPPDKTLGSYAGAFGVTQFMPSSFRAYAVDEDGDGRRDVWRSHWDIIASVANYFHRHGWRHGRPIAYWLPGLSSRYPASIRKLSQDGANHWRSLFELRKQMRGALPMPPDWREDDQVALIEMQTKLGPRIALVHYNFYVITRWNRSYNYAMAAAEVAAMLGCERCKVE